MDIIKKMLSGEIDMVDFASQLHTNEALCTDLRNLIPKCAQEDPLAELWSKYSYGALKSYDFDLGKLLKCQNKFDNSIIDNLNIWGTVRAIFCFLYPHTACTTKYIDYHRLYLEATRDCFDGPEVRDCVFTIIQEAYAECTKSKQTQTAKVAIKKQFHIEDNNKYPRWIQGPEWPMGVRQPMRFIKQRHEDEVVFFEFEDVDTGTKKMIQQFF